MRASIACFHARQPWSAGSEPHARGQTRLADLRILCADSRKAAENVVRTTRAGSSRLEARRGKRIGEQAPVSHLRHSPTYPHRPLAAGRRRVCDCKAEVAYVAACARVHADLALLAEARPVVRAVRERLRDGARRHGNRGDDSGKQEQACAGERARSIHRGGRRRKDAERRGETKFALQRSINVLRDPISFAVDDCAAGSETH